MCCYYAFIKFGWRPKYYYGLTDNTNDYIDDNERIVIKGFMRAVCERKDTLAGGI